MSLGVDSCWSWLCDIRNPGIDSLIKFKFYSYSVEDDDYEGYDYSFHSKFSAVWNSGYFPKIASISAFDKDELVSLFANDFSLNGSSYGVEELEVLKSLPIYKTAAGSYTSIGPGHCVISSNSSLKPHNEHCLSYTMDSVERLAFVLELYSYSIPSKCHTS